MAKRKFENGQQAEITQDTSGHRQPVGTVVTIKGKQNGYYFTEKMPNVYFMASDLKAFTCTVETLTKEIENHQNDIKQLQTKIDYLKETGEEKFCMKQYKAYQTLKLLQDEQNLSLIEKARRVAELYS
jgi:hypothetical protein